MLCSCDLQKVKQELEAKVLQHSKLSEDFKMLQTQYINLVEEYVDNADLMNTKQHQLEAIKEELTVTKIQVSF